MSRVGVHIGGAGAAIGECCWELFALEDGLANEGVLAPEDEPSEHIHKSWGEGPGGVYSPRCVSVCAPPSSAAAPAPSEAAVASAVPSSLVTNELDLLRRQAEACDSLDGFWITNSIAGSSGAGFGAALLEGLEAAFPESQRVAFTLFPDTPAGGEGLPNACTALATIADVAHCCVTLDNSAVRRVFRYDPSTSITNLNHVIAKAISNITVGVRHAASHNNTLSELVHSLAYLPQLKLCVAATAPLLETVCYYPDALEQMPLLFNPGACLTSCDEARGVAIAGSVTLRGDYIPSDVRACKALVSTKWPQAFPLWDADVMAWGYAWQPPRVFMGGDFTLTSRESVRVTNTSAITQALTRLTGPAAAEGTEGGEARETVCGMISAYADMEALSLEDAGTNGL